MNLFTVQYKGKPIKGVMCPDKVSAKLARESLGGVEAGYTVGKGPDHKSYGNRQGRICRRKKIGRRL